MTMREAAASGSRPGAVLLASLMLAGSFAGCVGGEEATSKTSSQSAEGHWRTVASMSLDAIPEDHDWLLLEVTLQAEGDLEAFTEGDLVLHPRATEADPGDGPVGRDRDACALVQGGSGLAMFIQPARAATSVQAAGASGNVSVGWPGGQGFSYGLSTPLFNLSAGASVPVLFGLDEAHDWGSRAQAWLNVTSTAPVETRVVTSGDMACATRPQDFEHGRFVSMPGSKVAEDLSTSFSLDDRGVGYVFVRADGSYHAVVEDNGTTAWEAKEQPMGSLEAASTSLNLSSGPATIRVPELVGVRSTGVSYLLLDLPPWAAFPFVDGFKTQEEEAENEDRGPVGTDDDLVPWAGPR